MLEEAMKTTIRTLYEKGYNKTQIAQMLGIDRKTVRKILKEDPGGPPLTKDTNKGWPSKLDEYREFIEIQLAKNLSITRIYQDLQREFNVKCGYSTVRDYAAKIKKTTPHAYMVLQSMPGEEAQVDFGYIGTLKIKNSPHKAWIFVMTLSYSRYMYVEITLDQSVETFIRCHVNAFRFFGGVPQTVKIDNLKAAIVEADFYEPVVQRNYAAFADHYGFLPNPCRVRTPTDKGKVEANVKYVKENCFKGRDFENLDDAREFLKEWLKDTANNRIHGTTGKIPSEIFNSIEKAKLKDLPIEDFYFTKSVSATVRTDCHIVYEGNFYSVPYTYIGCDVTAIVFNHLLKVYYEGKEIALHTLAVDVKGEFITDKNHYPSNKTIAPGEILSRYQEQMSEVGNGALLFLEKFKETEMYKSRHFRSLSGILSLRKKYGDEAVDRSCFRACYYGNITYRAVKKICESDLYLLPLENEAPKGFETEGSSRDLAAYSSMTELGVIGYE